MGFDPRKQSRLNNGEFGPRLYEAPSQDLEDTNPNMPSRQDYDAWIEKRRQLLKQRGWVKSVSLPVPTVPATTKGIKNWWKGGFDAYGANNQQTAIPVLPDNWSKSFREGRASTGHSLEGNRRVSRMCYQAGDRNIRMPSKTAIRHYMNSQGINQLQVPLSIDTPTGPRVGYVTLTRNPNGSWVGHTEGFDGEDKLYVEEASAAIMENRNMEINTPYQMRKRAQARAAAHGTQPIVAHSSWAQEYAYDKKTHTFYMSTLDGNSYAYKASPDFDVPTEADQSFGRWFNQKVKGKMEQIEGAQCPDCGNFVPDLEEHVCRFARSEDTKRTHATDLYSLAASGEYPVFDRDNDTTGLGVAQPNSPMLRGTMFGGEEYTPLIEAAGRSRVPWAYRDGATNGENGQIHYDGVTPDQIPDKHLDQQSRRIITGLKHRDGVEIAGTMYAKDGTIRARAISISRPNLPARDDIAGQVKLAEQYGIPTQMISRGRIRQTSNGPRLTFTLLDRNIA